MGSARLLLGVAVLAALGGCGTSREETERSAEAYRRELHEQARLHGDMVKILGSVKDRGSMAEALARLGKIQPELERAAQRFKRLGRPSPEVEERLQAEMNDVSGARRDVLEQMRRIADLPGGDQFLEAVKRIASPDRR